jgi:rare lipoprotein A
LSNSKNINNTISKVEIEPTDTKDIIEYEYTKVSWYGPGFNGRKTANGEIFNQNDLVAASPFLPFGTKVEIINVNNNKSVIVRINDRGPYKMYKDGKVVRPLKAHPVRAFDLSKGAFDEIANLDKGIIKVKYRIIDSE